MSRKKVPGSLSPTARKRQERSRRRAAGKVKIEAWIPSPTKELLDGLASRLEAPLTDILDLVLVHATPLYLREVGRRLDEVLPLLEKMCEYEFYGIQPGPPGAPPIRIRKGQKDLFLDPADCRATIEKAAPLLSQLQRYGLGRAKVFGMVPQPIRRRNSTQ